ncbi:V-set domain containing T-cell activation inhibitor 1-like [Micropterus salmoides]|uniref:V-set domain containing T-cell activation inhibitor 1-like n=1 Tax=Micropterus salmoides TaxID=27706 RepID=UPI0018EE2604|nr:V-set domain containing T-cell activation inhibitor 1-like [Micropterus salmoides]
MFTLTSELLLTLFASSWIFVLCQETQEVKVKPGEDVTLQCQSHRGADISLIGWSRTDLKPDDSFVFLFRDGGSNENNQHPSFRGRVNLRDPEMKNGDASVILKNVDINDTGTYECQIREGNKEGKSDPSSVIKLTVTGHTAGHKEGGDKEINVGLMVGLPVIAVLLVALAVHFMA